MHAYQQIAQDLAKSVAGDRLRYREEHVGLGLVFAAQWAFSEAYGIVRSVTVTNTSSDYMDNIALTKIFPSGWEIVNTSFTDLGGGASGQADYKDIRDDRVNFYFDLGKRKSKTFKVRLNASYLGTYYLPGVQAEAMYDNNYYARDKGRWIKVVR